MLSSRDAMRLLLAFHGSIRECRVFAVGLNREVGGVAGGRAPPEPSPALRAPSPGGRGFSGVGGLRGASTSPCGLRSARTGGYGCREEPLSPRERGWGEGPVSPGVALRPNPHPPFGHPSPGGEGFPAWGLRGRFDSALRATLSAN